MAKKDWLSREHRLRVAELALQWLTDCGKPIDAYRFGCACTVIERYLVDGGPKTVKLHREKKPKLKVVVPFKRAGQ